MDRDDMGTYEASVQGDFAARHALPLPGGGKEQPHTHQWQVKAVFQARSLRGPMDVVIDFVEVKRALDRLAAELDGRDLDAQVAFADHPPSAERVAEYLAGRLAEALGEAGGRLVRLAVTEAPGCEAAYYPPGRS